MIRTRRSRDMTINLGGPEGNAFILLGYARKLARQLCMNGDMIALEMQAGEYGHLVKTFDHYFGDYVILETEKDYLLDK